MAYSLNPIHPGCICCSVEGEIPPRDLALMGYEIRMRAKARRWRSIMVDMSRLRSTLTPPQILDLAQILAGEPSRRSRLAFVVRPDHARQAGWATKLAQRSGLCLSWFRDPRKAARWISPAKAPVGRKLEGPTQ